MSIKTKSCPYNPAHIMPEISLAGHLSKCTFRTNDFDSCRYNAMHIMRKERLADHEQRSCEDRHKHKNDDDDWGITEEIRQKMKDEIKEKRQAKKAQKKAANKKEVQPQVEKQPRKQQGGFQEPDFAGQQDNPINLTTINESGSNNFSSSLNESMMSMNQSKNEKKKKKGDISTF